MVKAVIMHDEIEAILHFYKARIKYLKTIKHYSKYVIADLEIEECNKRIYYFNQLKQKIK